LFLCSLVFGTIDLSAQATVSPQLHCINVDSAGHVTLTWALPPHIPASFSSYNIYTTTNKITGPWATSATVTSPVQTSVTIPGLNPNISPVYFYILTDTLPSNLTVPTDTLESIFLKCTNIGGVAQLTWNAMHTPNLPSFNGWYKIYREYHFKWSLLDSTQNLSYNDTINFCHLSKVNYQIVTNDASGCQSSSNWAGGSFQELWSPQTVYLDSVSVGPGNNVSISWYPSNAKNDTGYVVYIFNGTNWQAVDTIHSRDTTWYNYTKGDPGAGIVQIRIAALDSCKNVSPMDSTQNTIFLTGVANLCEHTYTLTWNNFIHFLPNNNNVGHYNIYCSYNGSTTYQLVGTTPTGVTTFTRTNINQQGTYCYFVRAVDSTDNLITSSSNIVCYTVTIPPPPKFSYLRSATVNTSSTQNQVYLYSATGAGVKEYIVERAPNPMGIFDTIGNITANNGLFYSFVDPTANPNIQSYTYKIFSKDSCNYIIDSTNIGQTIYLTAVANASGQNILNWNDYQQWQGAVSYYNIYRNEDDGAFSLIKTVGPGQDSLTDNISNIITGQGLFCYYIQAVEGANGTYAFVDTSLSNIACAYQDPIMYIPNAFNPKGVNKVFIPVGVFVGLQNYDFQIFDRWGQLLFETTETTQGWDGTFHGRLVEEDVYVYHIVYTSSKGEFFNRKGTVMMLK